jgi:uncharacterized RDD family membrane protein YckC
MSLPDPTYDPEFYQALLIKRVLAWVIDMVVTLLLVLAVLVMTMFLAAFILPVVWVAVSIAYRTVMLGRWGATAGMMLLSIKLRHLDGSRPDAGTCFFHALIFSGAMISVVGQILSVALMLLTPYRQGLNDVFLRTTIINRYIEG